MKAGGLHVLPPLLLSAPGPALGFHSNGAGTTTRIFWRDVSGSRGACSHGSGGLAVSAEAACWWHARPSTLLQTPCADGEIPRQLGQHPLCPHVGLGAEEQRRKGICASTALSTSPDGSRAARTSAAVCTARRKQWHS